MLIILWFRQDLRIQDNTALAAAINAGAVVIPVYVYAPAEHGKWAPGAASRWWLHHALADVSEQFSRSGYPFIIRKGTSSADVLKQLVNETGAGAVYWNRCYEP